MIIRTEELVPTMDFSGIELRPADAKECAAGGLTPEQAIHRSVKGSLNSWAVYVDDELVALWGYSANMIGSTCQGWLLTTPAIVKYKFRFVRTSKRIVSWLSTVYSNILVLVDREYDDAFAWLRYLGFEVADEVPNFLIMRKGR